MVHVILLGTHKLMHKSLCSSRLNRVYAGAHLSCASIVHSLRAAEIAGVCGLVEGRYVLQQGPPHAIQLEDVAVLTGPRLYLQNGTALVLLYHTLHNTRLVCFCMCRVI